MSPLDAQRPDADKFTVQRLVERAQLGLLRVPQWQRLFQWKAKNIRELLDSIARGFPVGTLLLWKRPEPAPAARLELGPHVFDVQESPNAHWVIDGQQRITTLTGVLARRGPPDRDPEARDQFTWAYDLNEDVWINPKPTEPWKPGWLPADRLVDATDLLTWLLSHKDTLTPPQIARANALGRDIREFEIPAIVVSAQSDETLRVIFDRMNNAGKKMKVSDTFDALQGALSQEQPSTIKALAKIPHELDFGPLPKDWLLRLVVQVGGGDMTTLSHETLERKGLAAALPRAADALRRTLVFIKNDVGIANEALLPYRLPLIVLSVFFDKHPEPNPRSLDLLARWVWRGAQTGRHRGQDVGEVRRMFALVGSNEEASVQRLLQFIREPLLDIWQWQAVNLRTASSRLELLALISLAPRDLFDGSPIPAAELVAAAKSKALRRLAPEPEHLPEGTWSHFSTRVLHPTGSQAELLRALKSASAVTAASHAIGAEALDLLRAGNLSGFLRARNSTIVAQFEKFIGARTRWSESTRPSIAQLSLPDVEVAPSESAP
jgi:hypothetical protein